ncbi:MAG: hypothetical protein AAGB04_23640 [Pseudomonadota bacterium]
MKSPVLQMMGSCMLAFSMLATTAHAQSSYRDAIADWLQSNKQTPTQLAQSGSTASNQKNGGQQQARDPREGDKEYEQAKRLMQAIDAILADAADQRTASQKLPSKDDFLLTPLWTETKEDRQQRIQELLDAALGIVTDVPVVDVQKRIEQRRKSIRELEDSIVQLREKQLTAPKSSLLPGVIADTVDSLGDQIKYSEERIAKNRDDIESAKQEIHQALAKSGLKMSAEQVDLLLGGVLSGDLVRLVAVFNSAKMIDQQLGKRMAATGENMKAARKYFAMHAALFAMLVHAQDSVIEKIDTKYIPKLRAIMKDLRTARRRTQKLLRGNNRADQKRILESNLRSQALAEKAARGYERYLKQQREQVAQARRRAARDLSIADNTYETVEASFQLRNLMQNTKSTFEALQKLEAPTFEQIFKNEELRREFENLTKKLEVPTS